MKKTWISEIKEVRKIKNLSLEEASCIPECFFTAWSNLVKTGRVKDNQQVLIHGGTSGVGLACIQILKLLKCKIFTTVGSNKKKRFCKKIGVDNIINYKENDFYEEIKKSNLDFRNLKVNNKETFGNHADQKRRPRIIFKSIKEHFGNDCKMIFDGNINELI